VIPREKWGYLRAPRIHTPLQQFLILQRLMIPLLLIMQRINCGVIYRGSKIIIILVIMHFLNFEAEKQPY